jgi:signal transduction histidine kinase
MPDTIPYWTDTSGGDRAVVDYKVADPGDTATARTGIPQTFGRRAQRTANGAEPPSIVRRLTILVIVTILPVLAYSAFTIVYYSRDQRAQYEQQLQATVHATSLAIDAGISRQFAILATLRNSRELKDRDWPAFYDLAKAAVDEPGARILVYDPSALQILSTFVPYGTDLPKSGNPEAVLRVVQARQPYVSDLFVGGSSKTLTVSTYLPVIENDAVVNVIGFSMSPTNLSRILQRQMAIPGGLGALFDRKGKLIARTRDDQEFVGRPAALEFLTAIGKSEEGRVETRSFDGRVLRAAFTRSALSGWSTTLAVEEAALDAPLWRSLWIFGGGGAVLVAGALLFAFYYSRRIAQPLIALSGIAAALGRGERIPAQHLNLKEAQAASDQMYIAGVALEQRAREVDHLNATLSQRADELAVANRELEGLSYSTSHVLRAPLRAIDGYAHILLDEHSATLDSEGKRLIGVLRSSARALNEQIEGMLEFLRLSRDKMSRGNIEMAEVVRIALKKLEPATQGRQLTIEVSPLPSAFGDAAMIGVIWMNLLDNAIKYTAPKNDAKIDVGALSDGAETVYYVRDNGVGFDMRFAGKLFGIFSWLHGAEFPGNGTGLAIVQRIVVRHGGRIWAEGKVGEGATFHFVLPVAGTSTPALPVAKRTQHV